MDAPAVNPAPPRNSPSLALSPPFGTHRRAAHATAHFLHSRRARRATHSQPDCLLKPVAPLCASPFSFPFPFSASPNQIDQVAAPLLLRPEPQVQPIQTPHASTPRFLSPTPPLSNHEPVLPTSRQARTLWSTPDEFPHRAEGPHRGQDDSTFLFDDHHLC